MSKPEPHVLAENSWFQSTSEFDNSRRTSIGTNLSVTLRLTRRTVMTDYRKSLLKIAIGLGTAIGMAVGFNARALAFQSGSSNGASAAGSGSRSAAEILAAPSWEIPQPSFSSPQADWISPHEISVPQPSSPAGRTGAVSQSTSPGIPESALVDPVFAISDPMSIDAIDHSPWNCFLARYLITDSFGVNRLQYQRVSQADRAALKTYLNHLQAIDTRTLNRDQQLAFWFNLYNARTADVVLDNYPIRSVRQIKTKLTDFVGPFDDPAAVTVLGIALSLNQIESGIVRPVWKDPRIHYALNCASLGCPNLSPTAWTAELIDGRLNAAAYAYINSDRGLQYGSRGVRTSKIFKWYKNDFGGTDAALLNHFRQYASPTTLEKLRCQQKISGHFYDWSLNDARITRRRLLEPIIR